MLRFFTKLRTIAYQSSGFGIDVMFKVNGINIKDIDFNFFKENFKKSNFRYFLQIKSLSENKIKKIDVGNIDLLYLVAFIGDENLFNSLVENHDFENDIDLNLRVMTKNWGDDELGICHDLSKLTAKEILLQQTSNVFV